MDIYEGEIVTKIILTLLAVGINYFIAYLAVKLINKKIDNYKLRHKSRRFSYYIATGISILIIIGIWAEKTGSLATYAGFLSAGLALALRDVLMNIAGWILINIRTPYGLGDRIEWGETKGDVIDIRLFYTTLLEIGNWVDHDQSTGRLVHLPNRYIFEHALFNYTHDFEYLWNEEKFLVTFDSDWKLAQKIIDEVAQQACENIETDARKQIREMAKKYMIKYSKFTPISYIDIKDSGVQITLRYLSSARKRRFVQNLISQQVLERFNQEEQVEFAYPTKSVYMGQRNNQE